MNKLQTVKVAKQVFDDEILGITQVKDFINDSFVNSVELIYNCKGKVIVMGMGKSGHIGNKISATLASTGTPAFFVHPAEALHGDLGMIDGHDVVIAISYSGESDELNAIVPIIKHKKIPIIAITSNLYSSLAKVSTFILNVKVSKEACPLGLAPTTSTTATLVMGDALAVSLLELRGFQAHDFALSHPGGSLGRKLLTKVRDIMRKEEQLPIVNIASNLKEIVLEITIKGLGLVAVEDNNKNLVGIITDYDLRRILNIDLDFKTIIAHKIMNKNPKLINVDQLAVDAVTIMRESKINGLLVVDTKMKLVGAFNMHDLFKAKLI